MEEDNVDEDGDVTMEAAESNSLNVTTTELNETGQTILNETGRTILNETGQTILSICNPLEEDARIRQHLTSEVLCTEPNPVQVPSCVKGAKCKPLVIYYNN